MRNIGFMFMLGIASASMLALSACSSSGWGQRGSQQSGDTHTLTGGAESAPTSESTPRPAGASSTGQQSGTQEENPTMQGGTSGGTSGPTSRNRSSGASSDTSTGTSDSSGGTATPEGGAGGGSMNAPQAPQTPPAQPVPPTENMGSSAGPTGTNSGGKNPQSGQ